MNTFTTPYEVFCRRCKIPFSPYVNCICKSPVHNLHLNRCEGCLKSERRRLREAYRDFVGDHPEISDEAKNELWKWIITELDYRAPVIVVNV